MRLRTSCLIVIVLCGSAFAGDNLSKLNKELKKIDDVASVKDGRRIVNHAMADQFGIKRLRLVAERRETGFNYGQLFAAHEFASEAKLKFESVAAEMKSGKTLAAIAEIHDIDLKDVVKEARSLNSEISKALDEAADDDSDNTPDLPDASDNSYDPSSDSEPSDTAGMSPKDLARNNAMVHSQGTQHASAAQGVGLGRANTSGGASNPGFGSGGFGGGRPSTSPGASGSHRPPL